MTLSRIHRLPTAVAAGLLLAVCLCATLPLPEATAYPPAVGILGKSRNCVACHTDNGPWKDDENQVLDLLDKATGKSLRQADGSFLVSARAGEKLTLLTVIGRAKSDPAPPPNRNGWTFVDPALIPREGPVSKFAAGWDVDLSMSCRLVGDSLKGLEGANVTVLPMTVRPHENARDGELEWQVLMTSGTAVKGDANKGLAQNNFQRKVRFQVTE